MAAGANWPAPHNSHWKSFSDQRGSGIPPGEPDHSPDKDRVIAAIVARLGFALEDGHKLSASAGGPSSVGEQIDAL